MPLNKETKPYSENCTSLKSKTLANLLSDIYLKSLYDKPL